MITVKKLLDILDVLKMEGFKFHGCSLYALSSGELALQLNTQPDWHLHKYLKSKGFVLGVDGATYIYRPR